ncbi:Polynucleotide 5'-hydroxyl-kinase nol-9 [Caenorhabditis elegans]|uniref:Polynucleotide 5'-hydroxyl-kinase nol-9 n=2 Tax=Caenorhabditis elegans TaxID=6239 RepID=NOL9_CAEEL|nr:Polynucleotide 5'-hydroxyl-kinase nol-9 [Caenorhabditis elegans]Q9U3B6.1 RecName: Full=Polynucleotide 5'-hydroxyl-kinase nol-9; AltName: Full=Nucleolar protein 9 homolog [Caenorhabditis elegans]CAB63234.1 Polynucleotide 5'-hydroxyl-kinase nol-9 [Caenorhabditis elegans]|eukprot:NP_001255744.1 Polynucleotide 5'-hydroxyl-kinase nol-9 [Caenorhabditis elegans]
MEEVVRFECRDSNLEIYVVQPGERLSIFGSCSFLCLAGNASINDYNLPAVSCESSNFMKISAPQRMDVPAILQVFKSGPSYKHARLKFRLKEVAPKNYEKIMEMIGTTEPSVFIFSKILDFAEETVSGVVSNFLIHSSIQKQIILPPHFFISRDDFIIYPQQQEAQLKSQMNRLNKLRNDGQRTTILPIGHKGAGKSNLMRSLVNRCLSNGYEHVYVLDCDIGQSEFTPCGCLSLTKVTSPILGKPHGHQRASFENSFFYGDITVRDINLYMDIFERLFNKFKVISEPGSVCIINSMGWVTDEGAEILDGITRVTDPELFVEIFRDQTEARYQFLNRAEHNIVEIFANNSIGVIGLPPQKRLPAALIRELTIVGYFSSRLPRPSLASFPKVAPYKLRFENVTICVPVDLLVEDSHVFSSINTQIMALCINNTDLKPRKLYGKDDLPSICVIDGNSPALQCIGFGIIRGVSVEERIIFVVTPVDLLKLEEPPVLVRGMRIQTPTMFYTADPYNRCPYVLNDLEQGNSDNTLDGLYQPSVNTTQFKRSRRF